MRWPPAATQGVAERKTGVAIGCWELERALFHAWATGVVTVARDNEIRFVAAPERATLVSNVNPWKEPADMSTNQTRRPNSRLTTPTADRAHAYVGLSRRWHRTAPTRHSPNT